MRNTILRAAVIASAIAAVSPAMAYDLNPYLGADYKFWGTDNDKRAADALPDNFRGGNYFLGTQFHENFSLELGYSYSGSKSKTKLFNGTERFYASTPVVNHQFVTKVNMRSLSLSLNGLYPIMDQLDLMGTFSIASVDPRMSVNATLAGAPLANYSIKGKSGFAANLGAGLRYMFTHNWGARGMINWQNNSGIKADFVNFAGTLEEIRPYSNDVSFSFGLFYQW